MKTSRILTATALVAAFAVSTAYAQQPQRLSGTIERVEGNTVFAKGRDNAPITLKLPDNVMVTAVLPATVADIKPGAYIGSGATPQADGSQKAVEVHIFAESQRGQGDGHRPGWYGTPNGTMTNGALQTSVASVDGQILTVEYKIGDKTDVKKILVTPKTIIATTVPGTKADLKPGLKVFVAGAPKLPDGSLDVAAIQVEKEIPPPQ